MANSIYDQLSRGLKQSVTYSKRSIFYRGTVIPCMVMLGANTEKLAHGGLQADATIHVQIQRELVPTGADGEPRVNETVRYPALPSPDRKMVDYVIEQIIGDEFAYCFTLMDPSR